MNYRELMDDFLSDDLDHYQYIQKINVNEEEIIPHINNLLLESIADKNADEVEYAIMLGFTYGFTELHSTALCRLLSEQWHIKHEDIASLFQHELRDQRHLDCLLKGLQNIPAYMEYNEGYSFINQCIWSISVLNTLESKKALIELSKSENIHKKNAAIFQLTRLNDL